MLACDSLLTGAKKDTVLEGCGPCAVSQIHRPASEGDAKPPWFAANNGGDSSLSHEKTGLATRTSTNEPVA